MTEQDILLEKVQTLINRRVEGPYWDFKLLHHDNNAALIHDVLCLANAHNDGPRYLIFGVDDQTFTLSSIENTPNCKTQADIVGFFRDNASKFFQSRTPTFYLRELKYGKESLDVLVIEDMPHKPYFLIEDYRCNEKKVRAHHIYTRVGDTNTPITEAAPPHEIERMWRERFGLDKPPLERAKLYLREPDAWTQESGDDSGDSTFYHTTFPEFTLRVDSTGGELLACNEEWTRGEICKNDNTAGYLKLYYHQTLLTKARFVVFDNRKKSMVAPDWKPRGTGRFYFYRADSIAFALQGFWSAGHPEDHSKTLRVGGRGQLNDEARMLWPSDMAIPVLHTGELEGFLASKDADDIPSPSTDETEQYQLFLHNQIEFELCRRRRVSDMETASSTSLSALDAQ